MQRKLKLRCCWLITITMAMTFSLGQDQLTGSITYISKDFAYMDLGKKHGVNPGDTVRVVRDKSVLGETIVIQSSGASSALRLMDAGSPSWQIGDEVHTNLLRDSEPVDSSSLIRTPLPLPKDTLVVFLDSSAYQPSFEGKNEIDPTHFKPKISGYISARVDDRGGSDSSKTSASGSIYGQLNIRDIGLRHLDARLFVRGRQAAADQSFDAKIYSIMLSYADPNSSFKYQLGRIYHPQLSMLGTIDGLGITWQSKKHLLAVIAGQEASIMNIDNYKLRRKIGLVKQRLFDWGSFQYGGMTDFVGSELSRNYVILGSSQKLSNRMRIRNYSEFDLDLLDQTANTQLISITRFRSSVSWKPWGSFSTNFRYSYRENVLNLLDTATTEFEMAARHALNANVTWMMNSSMTFTGQAGLRTDGDGRQIQIYGLSTNQRNFVNSALTLNGGLMVMFSYVSEGGRVYASMGKEILPWLDVDIYDEVFLYRILGESSFRTRHLPEVSFSAKVPGLNRLRLRTRFEQEDGELFYRFSLSASRQF
ncbi:hypothetical protein HQ531_06595 [bacterium]|nr:hypothetical protein [bacterium]